MRYSLNYLHCKNVCIYVENAFDIYARFVDSLEAYRSTQVSQNFDAQGS